MERCHNRATSIVGGQRELGMGTVLHKQDVLKWYVPPLFLDDKSFLTSHLPSDWPWKLLSTLSSVVIESQCELEKIRKKKPLKGGQAV